MRRTTVVVDGIRAPVIEAGPSGAADAAVFVHGNPGSADDFLALVEATGRHGRAIAMDMPGFGRADTPADWGATVADYGRHLAALLDHLGVARAHLVLHDFGGPWGMSFVADQPDRAGSLVLVNTVAMPGYRWHRLARGWRTPRLGEALMAAATRTSFAAFLREGNPRPIPAHHADRMWDHFDDDTRRTVLALYRDTDPEVLDDLAARVAAAVPSSLPVRVVWGDRDPYISPKQAEALRQVFPRARFTRIRDAGHWPFLTHPEVTDPVIVDWLATHLG
jgi:pimeloyl-ACP methyl ester carboxylesterase